MTRRRRCARTIVGLATMFGAAAQSAPTRATQPGPDEDVAVLEAVVRHTAMPLCRKDPCYLDVDEKPASQTLLARLADLENVLPGPPSARQPKGRVVIVSLRSSKVLPEGGRSVWSSKSLIVSGKKYLFDDCVFHLFPANGRWQVDDEKSLCAVF
jgi:hypothetical protein